MDYFWRVRMFSVTVQWAFANFYFKIASAYSSECCHIIILRSFVQQPFFAFFPFPGETLVM